MNLKSKILFLGKKNCFVCKKMHEFLKLNSKNVIRINIDKSNKKKSIKKLLDWKGDYIFSFRSKYIIPNILLNKTKIAAINFHPGPPNYRGIGCINFSILNNEKYYGLTCHYISKKIDNGKIIDVKRFKLNPKDSIDQILSKTYKLQLNQFKYVIRSLKKSNTIQKLINNSKKEKWSKKLYTQSMLENLYNINRQMEKKNFELELYLRATITKNFKPYYKVGEKLFYIS